MSHAIRLTSSRFQKLFAVFFHVSQQAQRCPTIARVAMFWMLGTWAHVFARTRRVASVATKRKNAAIPFAAFDAIRLLAP
jgi:hypothetical protein